MLEGYITPLLMSYINKYVNNIKPSDLKVSFWGGDAVLRNLELRLDVLKKELYLPLEFKSGFVRELVIHLPWSSIASTSVEVTIKDLELVVQLKSPQKKNSSSSDRDCAEKKEDSNVEEKNSSSELSKETDIHQGKEAKKDDTPPGYLQGYMNRILNNVQVHIQNMVVKVVEEESDLMLTLNVGSLEFYTANKDWAKEFVYTDYFQGGYKLNKVCEVKDIAVNLNPIEIGEKAQGSFLHEPFLKRSCLTCRVQFEYGRKILIRKSFEVLFDNLEFSVDEKQFCLFLHLLERLLGMYYNSKKLKGRDDETESKIGQAEPADHSTVENMELFSAPLVSETCSTEDVKTTSKMDTGPPGGGWGSWLWSVVGGTDEENEKVNDGDEMQMSRSPEELESLDEAQENLDEAVTRRVTEAKKKASELANVHFSVMAKSVTITFKMTQQVQTPVFLSLRSFTCPIMVLRFAGCLATVDRCPLTRSLVATVGIGRLTGEVMGYCPCVKKFPSSWRRLNTAGDSIKAVHVFSLGPDLGISSHLESSVDKKVAEMEDEEDHYRTVDLLKYSLYTSQTDMEFPLDIDQEFLGDLGQPFKAVWFTYFDCDVSSTREVEECTEKLQVGEIRAVLSPDVVHRLELYCLSFFSSLEATPLVSTGMVVLGDPRAVTNLDVSLASISMSVTSATHFLPVMTTPTHKVKTPPMSLKRGKKSKRLSVSPLPGLHFTLGLSAVSMSLPMYGKNASVEFPQEVKLSGRLSDFRIETLSSVTLADGIDIVETSDKSQDGKVIAIPKICCNYKIVRFGQVNGSSRNTVDGKLKIASALLKLSFQNISKAVFVGSSWMTSELPALFSGGLPYPLMLKYQPPAVPTGKDANLSYVALNFADIEMGVSKDDKSSSYTGTLSSTHIEVGRGGIDPVAATVLYGPLETMRAGCTETIQNLKEWLAFISSEKVPGEERKMIDMLLTSAVAKDAAFSTAQCHVSGVGFIFEPAFLDFLHLLLVHSAEGWFAIKSCQGGVASSPLAGGPPGDLQNKVGGLPLTLTPSIGTDFEEVTDEMESKFVETNRIVAILKSIAVKVNIKPIVFVFPVGDTLLKDSVQPGSSSSGTIKFPNLGQILSDTPAVVLCSPHVQLESSKSHVLDEPVPRLGRTDTLPWDCSLTSAFVFTMVESSQHYLLQPVSVKASLAAQQEGLGITVHSEMVALALSKKQVDVVKVVTAEIMSKVAAIRQSMLLASGHTPPLTADGATPTDVQGHSSTPPLTSATPSSYYTKSDVSTVSSSYQGMSSLWLQLLVSKCIVQVFSKGDVKGKGVRQAKSDTRLSHPRPVKVSLEVEGLSLQVDVQEKCTDFVLKLTGMESYLSVQEGTSNVWEPLLVHSKGKLFSSSMSNLSDEVLRVTAHGFSPSQFRSPGIGRSMEVYSNLGSGSFLYLKGYIPSKLCHAHKLEANIRPFEFVLWLPVVQLLQSVLGFPGEQKKSAKKSPPGAVSSYSDSPWPSIQLSVDSFRVVFPSSNILSACLLLTSTGMSVSSSVDFAGAEVRHVTDQRGYRKLAILCAERKKAPLPAYQCNLYSMAIWGVKQGVSKQAFPYISNTDLQLTYTPPLHSSSLEKHMLDPFKPSSLVCGHCVEVHLTNDCCIFVGIEQIQNVIEVLDTNILSSDKDHPTVTTSKTVNLSECNNQQDSGAQSVPFKVFITGKTVTALLYSSYSLTSTTDPCSYEGYDVRIPASMCFQFSFYNPVLSLQNANDEKEKIHRVTSGDASVFDMAVTCSKELTGLVYTDLTDASTLPLGSTVILSTKEDSEGSKLPPNLLNVKFSIIAPSQTPASVNSVEVVVERSCKISCTPDLLKDIVGVLTEISSTFEITNVKQEGETVKVESKRKHLHSLPMVKISINRFLVDLILDAEQGHFRTDQKSPCPDEEEESLVTPIRDHVWVLLESMTLFSSIEQCSSGNDAGIKSKIDGGFKISGLQLLCSSFGNTDLVVAPVVLQTSLSQHLPNSVLDKFYFSVNVSVGLVDILLSQQSVLTLMRATTVIKEVIESSSGIIEMFSARMKNQDKSDDTIALPQEFKNTQQFNDDLRTLPFKYVIEDSETFILPSAGEIMFYNGNESLGELPFMCWHYWEPRVVTNLTVTPIPLVEGIYRSTMRDAKVGCSLEYWDDMKMSFISVGHFTVNEYDNASLDNLPGSSCARIWRISLTHLIDSIGEKIHSHSTLSGCFTDKEGGTVLLSKILSPMSLAASTVVDSSFHPSFLTCLSMNFDLDKLKIHIFHRKICSVVKDMPIFNGFIIDENIINQIYSKTFDLIQLVSSNLSLKLKFMIEDTHLMLNLSSELKYVDFCDLVWRAALCPATISFAVHHERKVNTGESSLFVDAHVGTAVLKVSQGLNHTISLAILAWKESFADWKSSMKMKDSNARKVLELKGYGAAAVLLPGYYIICNDTDQDLVLGQDTTTEKVIVYKGHCISYSWYSPSSPYKLRVAQFIENQESPEWTSSFSLSETTRSYVLQIPLILSTIKGIGSLNISIVEKGGMQKQVIMSGNWKFFSGLHIPIDIKIGISNDEGSFANHIDMKTLPPGGQLLSILAPDDAVGEMILKTSNNSTHDWSITYPVPCGDTGWSKPRILLEVSDSDGEELHFWFNTKPTVKLPKFSGHQITFSPLFAVKNCLPFDLKISISDTNSTGKSESEHSIVMTCLGNGYYQSLPYLVSEKWYWIKFGIRHGLLLSDQQVSLSTFLLHHLPFASSSKSTQCQAPAASGSSAIISVPMDDKKSKTCKVHAFLIRNEYNTITVVIKAEWSLLNQINLPLCLLESSASLEEEEIIEAECLPFSSQVLCQDEIVLKTSYNGVQLLSNFIKCPHVKVTEGSLEEGQSSDEVKEIIPIFLNPIRIPEENLHDLQEKNIIGEAAVSFIKRDTSNVAIIKASYVFCNNTDYSVRIKPFIVQQGHSSDCVSSSVGLFHECKPGSTIQILFWNVSGNFIPSIKASLTHMLSLSGSFSKDVTDSCSSTWSFCISTDFVRHSFSLPVMEASYCRFVSCLLTVHENDNVNYLVLQCDNNPSILITNLTSEDFQVVETHATGANATPQVVPAQQEVSYQPPSIAKLYPIVVDEEVATDKDKKLVHLAQMVELKFSKSPKLSDEYCGWSKSVSMAEGENRILIPQFKEIMLSVKLKDNGFVFTLYSTEDETNYQQVKNVSTKRHSSNSSTNLVISVGLSTLVCSLLDDIAFPKRKVEVLRAIITDLACDYSVKGCNSKIDITAYSLKVENMMQQHVGEFEVCFIPRSEHAGPSQLFKSDFPPLFKVVVHFHTYLKGIIHSFYLRSEPVTVQLEDCLLKQLKKLFLTFVPSELFEHISESRGENRAGVIPQSVLQESQRDLYPILIASFMIEPIAIFLSARITFKAFLSCNDTPLKFSRYELEGINSNWSEISRVVAARYISALYMHIGWILGSLELVGSPVSFFQSVSRGLRDLLVLPYEGLTRSPGMFLLGIGHGTASLFRQVSSGALTSVTNLTHSISRNMEKLSMDQDHLVYQEELRQKSSPVNFTSAVSTGMSSFGLSLMSAVAGLVELPMQSVQHMDESDGAASTVLKGVGKGLLGVVTKPVGGAMELISQTGQGILCGTGLGQKLRHTEVPNQYLTDRNVLFILRPSASYLRSLDMEAISLRWLAQACIGEVECLFFISTMNLLVFDVQACSLLIKYDISQCELEHDLSCQQNLVKLHIVVQRQSKYQTGASEQSTADVDIIEKYFKSGQTEEACQPETIYLYDSEDVGEKLTREEVVLDDMGLNNSSRFSGRMSENFYTMKSNEAQQFITLYHQIKETNFLQGHL